MANSVLDRAAIDAATSFAGDTDLINSLAHLDELAHQPHDKRGFSWTGGATAATFWVNEEAVVNEHSLKPTLVLIQSGAAESVDIVHVQKSGANANIVKTETVTLAVGLNMFAIDSSGVTFSSSTWIGIRPSGGSSLQYRSTSNFPVFNFASDGGAFSETGGFEISYWVGYHPRAFLPRVVEGIPAAEFDLAEALSQLDDVRLPAGDIAISAEVAVPNQKVIRGVRGHSRLVLGSGVVGLGLNQSNHVTLRDFTVVGNHSGVTITDATDLSDADDVVALNGMGTEKGIYIRGTSANRIVIDGVDFENIDGIGLDVSNTTSSTPLISHGIQVSNSSSRDCFVGLRFNETGEYCNLVNFDAAKCLIGLVVDGGNNSIVNANLAYNRVGLAVTDGSNNAHGTITGGNANHCELFGLLVDGITNGQNINGMHNWDSPILVRNSKGVVWAGGTIASSVFEDSNSVGTLLSAVLKRSVSVPATVDQHAVIDIDSGTIETLGSDVEDLSAFTESQIIQYLNSGKALT